MELEFYFDEFGAQYTIDKKKLIKLPSYIEEYEIIEGCYSFDNTTFEGCNRLKTLILPYTFSCLCEGCFDNCPTLSKLIAYSEKLHTRELVSSKYWLNMDMYKFFSKYPHINQLYVLPWTHAYSHLTNELISRLTTIRTYAIDYNDRKAGIRTINGCTYNRNQDILLKDTNESEYVNIKEGVKRIYKDAFASNFQIKKLTLPSTIEEIDFETFQHCEKLENIIIHAEHLSSISYIAPNVKKIYVPVGLKSKYESFKDKFKRFEIEELSLSTSDYFLNSDNCLYTKDKLRLISGENCIDKSPRILPETQEISSNAFKNNKYIEEIIIPYNVNSVGDNAFEGCANLKRLVENTSLSFQYLGNNVFKECKNLKEFYVKATHANYIKNIGFTEVYDLPNLYFENIKIDYDTHMIYDATKTKLVHIPNIIADKLIDYVIPEFVTDIYVHAFSNCRKLKTIKLSNNIKTLSGAPFSVCKELEKIEISDNAHFINDDGILFTSDRKKLIACVHSKKIGCYEVPFTVEEISDYAFATHKELKMLKLPEGLKAIGEGAFTMTSLEMVIIPSKVEIIGKNAFEKCPLKRVVFSGTSMKSVGEYAFLIDLNRINAFDYETWIPLFSGSIYSQFKEIHIQKEKNNSEIINAIEQHNGNFAETSAYEKAISEDTILAYELYLKKYPYGTFSKNLKDKMEEKEFRLCSSLIDYKLFRKKYTSGKYYREAEKIIKDKKDMIAFIITIITFFLIFISYATIRIINKEFDFSVIIVGGIISLIGTLPVCWLLGLFKKVDD